MEIASFKPQRNISPITILIYVSVVIAIGLIVYFGSDVIKNIKNLAGKSQLSVTVLEGNAEVFFNDTSMGKTPLDAVDVRSGENKVSIKNDSMKYEISLDFLPNTEVAIVRDLGINDTFSAGQNFWFEKGDSKEVLNVISDPPEAKVFIDNTEVGKTPYKSTSLTEDDYELRVDLPGYENRTERIKIKKGAKLNVAVKLFPLPVPSKVSLLEGSQDLYDLFSDNTLVSSKPSSWISAILYWNKTRGINLSGAGVNKEPVFDYFLDYNGSVYDKAGNIINDDTDLKKLSEAKKGAYLRRVSDGAVLSESAKKTYEKVKGAVSGKKIKVLDTGLGWLRVRDLPNLNGKELAKVNVGEQFLVLEEKPGWTKIKVSETVQGWVSSDYVQEVKVVIKVN